MSLGNKIADLRKKENLSQEKLAERLGVTRQTVSKWELGETAPDILQAKELSKIYNVNRGGKYADQRRVFAKINRQ